MVKITGSSSLVRLFIIIFSYLELGLELVRYLAGVTKHCTGPKYWSFLYEKRIESTCCNMKTDILDLKVMQMIGLIMTWLEQ